MTPGAKFDNLDKIFKKAEKYRRKEKYRKAIHQYFEYLDQDADNSLVWVGLAHSYNRMENYKEALWASKHALRGKDNLEAALDNIFYTYDFTGEYRLAIKVLKRYLKIRSNSKTLMSEEEFDMKRYELYKDLRYNGLLKERIPIDITVDENTNEFAMLKAIIEGGLPKDGSLSKSFIKLKSNMILKLNLENEEEINVLKKLVSRESPSDTWSPEIQLGPLPPKDGNISKLFLDKNIDFHILTLFEYSNIGNSEHIIRILKQILRYFPFKEDIWEKLAGVYRSYGK